MSRQGQFGRWIWLWLACYVVLVGLIVWWLFAARGWTLAESAGGNAQGNWQVWREEVERQQTERAPVRRRVPESLEPPVTVLLRDHFGVMLGGAVVLSSVLFWVLAWFVAGALATTEPHAEEG